VAERVGRPIDALILLDPVPSGDWGIRHEGKYFQIPSNVREAVCYHRPPGFWPLSYPILNPASAGSNNMRRIGHADFGSSMEVHRTILEACAKL